MMATTPREIMTVVNLTHVGELITANDIGIPPEHFISSTTSITDNAVVTKMALRFMPFDKISFIKSLRLRGFSAIIVEPETLISQVGARLRIEIKIQIKKIDA